MGNECINKLAGILQHRMHDMNDNPPKLDFGTIQSNMSLTTNQFPQPIPQSDYMVCRQLTLGSMDTPLTSTINSAEKTVLVPEKMRSIKAGDRVLVAWIGDDICIIDIILPGTAV